MAIYHLYVKVFGRNEGRSAVGAAAYRSASRMENDYDGVIHNYTAKRGVVYSEIMLPNCAPKEYADRNKLWNAVEMGEKAKDARLCREVEISLPVELPRTEQINLVQRFVQDNFVSAGMCADINIHDPPYTDDHGTMLTTDGSPALNEEEALHRNPHAHILLTVRPIDPETGKWQPKTQAEYLCLKNGIERAFTPEEFKAAKSAGWEKQYLYRQGKQKLWLTAAEGMKAGLKRVNNTAKATKYGRQNPITETWNSKDRIFDWRNRWEKSCNQALAAYGSEARIDARSKAAQGIEDEISAYTLTKVQYNMAKRAERLKREGKPPAKVSYQAEINAEIKRYNQLMRKIRSDLKIFRDVIRERISVVRRKLEEIRSIVIVSEYKLRMLGRSFSSYNKEEYLRLTACIGELSRLEDKKNGWRAEIIHAEKALSACGILEFKKKSELREQIATLQERIEISEEQSSSTVSRYGFSDMSYQELCRKQKELAFVGTLLRQEDTEKKRRSENITAFRRESVNLSADEKAAMESRDMVRQEYDRSIEDTVKKQDKDYDANTLKQAASDTDRKLGLDREVRVQSKTKHLSL